MDTAIADNSSEATLGRVSRRASPALVGSRFFARPAFAVEPPALHPPGRGGGGALPLARLESGFVTSEPAAKAWRPPMIATASASARCQTQFSRPVRAGLDPGRRVDPGGAAGDGGTDRLPPGGGTHHAARRGPADFAISTIRCSPFWRRSIWGRSASPTSISTPIMATASRTPSPTRPTTDRFAPNSRRSSTRLSSLEPYLPPSTNRLRTGVRPSYIRKIE